MRVCEYREYTPHPYHTPLALTSPAPWPCVERETNPHGRRAPRVPPTQRDTKHAPSAEVLHEFRNRGLLRTPYQRSSAAVQVTRFSPKIGPTTSDDGARVATGADSRSRAPRYGRWARGRPRTVTVHAHHTRLPSAAQPVFDAPPAYGSARPVSVCHTCLCSAHGWFRLPPEHLTVAPAHSLDPPAAPTPLPVCRRFGSLTATTVGACCDTHAMPRYGSSSDESGDSYGGTVTHWSLRADVTALESEGAT